MGKIKKNKERIKRKISLILLYNNNKKVLYKKLCLNL